MNLAARLRLARPLISLFAVLLLSSCALLPQRETPPLILVGIDALSPYLLDRGSMPNLNRLAAGGARAEFMRPSFPTKTFPNFYTLVTGLRPDHHGIVDNTMEDPAIPGVRFALSNNKAQADRRWWDQGEPVWVTAQRQGVTSGTMFWPGSATDIRGVRPAEWRTYDGKVTAEQRVDVLLSWLDKPAAERPRFMTLYFEDVDHAGHDFGPETPEVIAAAGVVDKAIGRLLDGLKARKIDPNLVFVADHGMAAISKQRILRMDEVLPAGSYRVISTGSHSGIDPLPGKEAEVAAALAKPLEHMQCWPREAIPARFIYGKNPRVPRFFCLADVGWYIVADARGAARAKDGGTHGYDNMAPEMRATFVAAGPSIAQGKIVPPIDNVDVYPFVMQLIGLAPQPNDGNAAALKPALR